MTRDEVIETTLTRLGNRQGETALVTSAEAEILIVQRHLERLPELPWFLLTRTSALTCTISQDYTDLPADFIRFPEEDESEIWLVDSEGTRTKVEIWDYDQVLARYGSADEGLPKVAALVGTRLYWGPTPDAAYTCDFAYYAKEDELTTDTSNQWTTEAPDLVIARLGQVLARYARDTEAAALFQEDAQAGLTLTTLARRQAARPRRMGGVV
jgi:hypothetical protein